MFWALFFSYFLSPIFAQNNANDAPVYLPTEYVEATPLTSFDEKTYLWPSQKIQPQTFQSSSIYESLNKSPGVQTQGETSGGSPSIRIRGSGSITRNIILLDGTPLQAQDGIGTNPLLLPHESLESMEIIKGPASLFYGADSVGGALNLKTKTHDRPTLRLGAETSNKYSSYFASPLIKNGNHFLQSSLYLEDGKNDYSYDSPTTGQAKRDNNQRTKQRYTLSGKNKLSRVLLTHQLLYAKEIGQSPGAVSTSPYVTDFNRTAYLGALGADIKLSTSSQLKTKLSYLQTESDNIESGAESEYKISKTYASVNYSHDVSSVLSFQVFTDFIYDTYKNTPTLSRKYSEDRYEHGAVLQYQLSDIDKIMAGFRFFPDQNEFVKNIMMSQDQKSYVVYASYSEGIQVPSFNQKYNDAYGMVPNPNLDVEKSSQVEIGLEKPSQKYSSNIWKKTHLKLSLFTIDYKNFIEYNASNSPFSYLNSGAVKSQGVEISAEYDFSIYNIYAAYSFLDTEIKDQNRSVAVTPEHQAYLLTGAMLGPVVFELHNTFWSEYRSDSSSDNREPSWIITDFTIRTVELNDWHFKAGVLNIFDKERIFTRFGTDYYPEPGRQYFVFIERYF